MIEQPIRWIDLIYIAAGINGIFIALAMIFFKKGSRIARFFISTLFILHSIDMIYRFIYAAKYHVLFPHVAFLDVSIPFVYGPLVYLYVRAFIETQKGFKKDYLIHFIPFLVYIAINLPFYILPSTQKLKILLNPPVKSGIDIHLIAHHAKIIHIGLYQFFAIRLLKQYNRSIKNTYSSIEKINLQWMRNLIGAGLAISILHYILIFIFSFYWKDFYLKALEIIHIFAAIVIFIFGYRALIQPEIFLDYTEIQPKKKYKKSGLTKKKREQYLKKILTYMEEKKLFIDSELTLPKLAEILSLPPHHISQIINEQLHQNFYEFINKYRVEEAKKQLADENEKSRTILDIAFDVGFKSKSAFNSIFKKYNKMTPSHFRKIHTQ